MEIATRVKERATSFPVEIDPIVAEEEARIAEEKQKVLILYMIQ